MLLSWCGWHMQVLCNFMKMLTWACYEAFGHHGGTKGVPWQWQRKGCHGNISMIRQLVRMSVQKKVWTYGTCKRRWGDPGYRVSHMSVAWLTANVQGTIRTWSKHRVHLIQHMHSVHGRHLGVIPSKRAFSGRIGFDGSGSSRSRDGSGSGGTRWR